MSKYTMQLRFPIEQRLNDLKYNQDEKNWKYVYKSLGLDDYPIFDESHRETLNNKIIRHYYFREIGFETMGQFRWELRERMHEIMPYYNQLYTSEGLITDPLQSLDLNFTETWTRDEKTNTKEKGTEDVHDVTDTDIKTSSTTDSNTTDTTHDRNVFQDTPMNGLDTGAIESMDYATNVTFDDTTSNGTAHTTSNGTNNTDTDFTRDRDTSSNRDYLGDFDGTKEHRQRGYNKSQSDLLLTYRETFRNIDLEVVGSLNDLFMGLW